MRCSVKRLLTVALFPALFASAGFALAVDDAAIEKKAKEVCAACHGPDGNTPTGPDFPRLAGQHYDYLLHSLKGYEPHHGGAGAGPHQRGNGRTCRVLLTAVRHARHQALTGVHRRST